MTEPLTETNKRHWTEDLIETIDNNEQTQKRWCLDNFPDDSLLENLDSDYLPPDILASCLLPEFESTTISIPEDADEDYSELPACEFDIEHVQSGESDLNDELEHDELSLIDDNVLMS